MLFFEEKISKHRHLDKITMIDKTDEYDMYGCLQHKLAGYYFYRTIRKLLSLAAARLIPWISLKCITVSSLKRNIVEQNLHIHRQPPVSTFVSAVGSLSLLVSGVSMPPLAAKVPMAVSPGERSRSPWSLNTCSTAILSREKTLLQSRHCLALPTFFSKLFFT